LNLDIERTVKENNMTFTENDKLVVKIPAGVSSGETIVIPEKGNTVNNMKGDIRLTFQIAKHDVFVRESDNSLELQYKTTISLRDALCGFTVEIPHICGKLLRVSNHSNFSVIHPGHRKEIPGLGMKRDNRTGKLTIIFDVKFPEDIDKEQRDQLSSILG
jgi:DnaJ-class molecular chaperone